MKDGILAVLVLVIFGWLIMNFPLFGWFYAAGWFLLFWIADVKQ